MCRVGVAELRLGFNALYRGGAVPRLGLAAAVGLDELGEVGAVAEHKRHVHRVAAIPVAGDLRAAGRGAVDAVQKLEASMLVTLTDGMA